MSVLKQILKNKLVAIIRGADPADVLEIVHALADGGIMTVEVTMNSHNALKVIEELNVKVGDKMLVGAGTVLDATMAKEAIAAGARFIISPHLNKEVVDMTKNLETVSIPGAFTATEIINAHAAGGDIIKIFPASPGAQYIKDIRGPLPHIPLMPTGGVNADNVASFFKAGAEAVGIGTALVDTKQKVTSQYLESLREKAKKFVQAVSIT